MNDLESLRMVSVMNNSLLNLIFAIVLSLLIIFGWQYFYERPRLDGLAKEHAMYQEQLKRSKSDTAISNQMQITDNREALINKQERVKILSKNLLGSISLKGLRFDDLALTQFKQTLDEDSPPVELFSPVCSKAAYFAEVGWFGEDHKLYPDSESIWKADKDVVSDGESVNFIWKNSEDVDFIVTVTLLDDYIFDIKQTIVNQSKKPFSVQFYGLINRTYEQPKEQIVNILHQGFVASYNQNLQEFTYDKIKEKKRETISNGKLDWVGITDKYWLAAFIPDDKQKYSMNYSYAVKSGMDKFQADFVSKQELIEPGVEFSSSIKLFAGAKKVDLLDKYEKRYNIPLFDRAIDFGWLYVLTKPIFYLMNFFYSYVGNFGISIMIVTVMIKVTLFSLANKSYRSMKKMKKLQPQMERLKELYAEDKARMNQEVMELYKREKVNPVSGCLPLLVQIPVFFAIYKVLYVTIEMRQAPFYGWIKDLSATDPTTIFNLFGLLPYAPPSFLHIGAWPIIMAITMYLQQRMSPEPADPVQAKVMKFMPLMFLFMFSSFPAGLLIYWSWNNILSILQQTMINKLDKS